METQTEITTGDEITVKNDHIEMAELIQVMKELPEASKFLIAATNRIRDQQSTLNRIESKIDTMMHGIIGDKTPCKQCGAKQ